MRRQMAARVTRLLGLHPKMRSTHARAAWQPGTREIVPLMERKVRERARALHGGAGARAAPRAAVAPAHVRPMNSLDLARTSPRKCCAT